MTDPTNTPSAEEVEREPDVRFTYANERTFLAWNRTALALIATGVAATQLLPALDSNWGQWTIGVPLIVLGAVLSITSFRHWRANERAMRFNQPLPPSNIPLLLAIGIAVIAGIAVLLAIFDGQ